MFYAHSVGRREKSCVNRAQKLKFQMFHLTLFQIITTDFSPKKRAQMMRLFNILQMPESPTKILCRTRKQHLIKLYAIAGKPFAALKLASDDNFEKSDEILEILSVSAEKVGEFNQAIQYEKAKSDGGNSEQISVLQKLVEEKNTRATDFTVDEENTKKL